MSRSAAPLVAAAHPHPHAHGYAHGHDHGQDHGSAPGHAAASGAPGALPATLLTAGAGSRLLGALGLLALLWLAVAWALGEPA